MAKIITITSAKGGVGKTTTSINLGAALNAFGHDVVIVDANLTTPNVGLHLGAPIVPISLNHVLNGKADIEDAIYLRQVFKEQIDNEKVEYYKRMFAE